MKKIIYNIALLGSVLCTSLAQGQVVLEALDAPNGKCLERVYDRNYGDGVHNFVYCAVQGPNGKKWLNLNLGAEYAREGSPYFNPEVQPTDYNDWKAFGSLFQEGRRADGHELVDYYHYQLRNNPNIQITDENSEYVWFVYRLSGITTDQQDPFNSQPKYVIHNYWSQDVDRVNLDKMWIRESRNNPCPQGYRIMNQTDIMSLLSSNYSKMEIQGGMYTPSIIKNIDFPHLNIVTAPAINPLNPRYEIVDNVLEKTSAIHIDNSNLRGSSTLWVIPNEEISTSGIANAYNEGHWSIQHISISTRAFGYSGFDRGFFTDSSSFQYGISIAYDFLSSMAIRCVEN